MFIPMFSWNVFRVNLIEAGLLSERQIHAMQRECYTMRKNDPVGRARSNNGSGWQSNDGIDDNPIFNKLMREIKRVVAHELMPYLGAVTGTAELPGQSIRRSLAPSWFHGWLSRCGGRCVGYIRWQVPSV